MATPAVIEFSLYSLRYLCLIFRRDTAKNFTPKTKTKWGSVGLPKWGENGGSHDANKQVYHQGCQQGVLGRIREFALEDLALVGWPVNLENGKHDALDQHRNPEDGKADKHDPPFTPVIPKTDNRKEAPVAKADQGDPEEEPKHKLSPDQPEGTGEKDGVVHLGELPQTSLKASPIKKRRKK